MKDLVERVESGEIKASVVKTSERELVLRVDVSDLVETAAFFKASGFPMFTDLTCADYYGLKRKPRFDLVVILYSFERQGYVRLLCGIPEDAVHVPTLTNVFKGANWPEREVFDLYGIMFDGHPGLKRILMPDDYEGFPLRRDFPITGMVPPPPLARE